MNDPNVTMLLTLKDLNKHFAELQNRATSIQVAVAWATQGAAIDMLCNATCRVDTFIGTNFNATDPNALERLQALGSVRVDERDYFSVFHPKLYLFKLDSHYEVIFGSPNLTDAAFSRNEETAVRILLDDQAAQELLDYFEALKATTKAVGPGWLRGYRLRYKRALRHRKNSIVQEIEGPQIGRNVRPAGTTVGKLLTYDWPSYVNALTNLSDPKDEDRIYNEHNPHGSYLMTLKMLNPILKRPFDQISGKDFRRVLGARETIPDSGWFGSLTAGGRLVHQLERNVSLRKFIVAAIANVRKAKTDEQVLDSARHLFEGMAKYRFVKHAATTRLLAIYRPDRFFSLNKKSIKKLSRLFDIPQARLKRWDGYSEALDLIWKSKWWRSQRPKESKAFRIWDARVALLDLYAYEP